MEQQDAVPMEWWEEDAASTPAEIRRRHVANKASWERAAAHYTDQVDDDIALLRSGASTVHPIERDLLTQHAGPLTQWCGLAVHLQCASGRDTLSLLNEGACRVVGIDIAEAHVRNARRKAAALAAAATFHCCDVLDAPRELDGNVDLVYTGRGAIGWLHDLDGWARVVARLLAPGGWLSLFDDHPASHLFDADADHLAYSGVDYFHGSSAGYGFSQSFVDHLGIPADEALLTHDRLWTFADLFAAITDAGLRIVHLGEHPEPYWDPFPNLPDHLQCRIPQTFSILARQGDRPCRS